MGHPEWLRPANEVDKIDFPFVAVGIAATNVDQKQLHVGLVHKGSQCSAELLHLAWHHCLRNESVLAASLPRIHWVGLRLLPERAEALAALCRRIAKRNAQEIAYGLVYTGGTFAADGTVRLGDEEIGLTCATFVLAALKGGGVELLQLETWGKDCEDLNWQEQIVGQLQRYQERYPSRISEQHIANVKQQIGCTRYKPDQVTGACSADNYPVDYATANCLGTRVKKALLAVV